MYLKALALDPGTIISGVMALASAMNRNSGASAPSLESPGVTVNTAVHTNVSPQISPVFVQQDSPTDSAVNAATQQIAPVTQSASQGVPTAAGSVMPGTPMTGAIPGVDYASGYAPTGTPLFPSSSSPAFPTQALAIGAALVGAALLLSGKRGSAGKGGKRRRAKA